MRIALSFATGREPLLGTRRSVALMIMMRHGVARPESERRAEAELPRLALRAIEGQVPCNT
jgi:hypothetical protein